MIQHYLCKAEFRRHDTDELLSVGHCEVWARGINDAKERAALDNRMQISNLTHVTSKSISEKLIDREITVEEEIIPGPDEVMFLAGYDSGNGECWTYDVTAWDFERVTGKAPDAGEGSWDSPSILEGLTEPHWQLGMDAILKWAGGRPIKLEAKKVPPERHMDTPTVYNADQMNRRAMTAIYLVTGVLDEIKERNVTSVESPGGIDFIDKVCGLAHIIDDWLEVNQIDVEELSTGVFLYEEVEEFLAEKVVDHAVANDGDLPTRIEFLKILEDLRTQRKKEAE